MKQTDTKEFLEAFRRNMGNIAATGRELKIKQPRSYVYHHKQNDPEFAAAIEEIKEELLDNVETELYRKIFKDRNIASIIFYLKCHGKDRGWIERQQFEGITGKIVVNVNGVQVTDENSRVQFYTAEDVSETSGDLQ